MQKSPPQAISQFVRECEPYLLTSWPFFSKVPGEKAIPGILDTVLALHIKAIHAPTDDADTIFFWNAARDIQKIAPLGITDKAVLCAGAALLDRKVSEPFHRTDENSKYCSHFKLAAGVGLTTLGELYWCRDFQETENNFVKWLLARTYLLGAKYERLAARVEIWQNEISEEHPNKMGDCFEEGFGIDHPFTKWTQGVS